MRKGSCKHFTGMREDKDVCKQGICYRTHVGGEDLGWCVRAPCLGKNGFKHADRDKVVPCDKYEEPTDAEVAAFDKEMDDHIAKFMAVNPLIIRIKKEHKGKSWKGIEECPVCKGRLHMTHSSYNGHVWGQCETTDCVSWIE